MASRSGKVIIKLAVVFVLLLSLIVVGVVLFSDSALRAGIETAGSKALKVPVTLESASLSILGGDVGLEMLQVGNPEGYANPNLLVLESGSVETSYASLLGDPVQIDRIRLEGVTVVVEQKGLTNNLEELLKGIETGGRGKEEPGHGETRDLKIKELELTGVQVKVKLLPIPGRTSDVTLELKPIRMTDVGSDYEISLPDLFARLLLAIGDAIVKEGAGILPEEITEPIFTVLKESGGLLIDTGEIIIDTGSKVLETGSKLGKDLLGVGDGSDDEGQGDARRDREK